MPDGISSKEYSITRLPGGSLDTDSITIEEPLEIWVRYPDKNGNTIEHSLSITMRTPGDDASLVTGFLFSEGIIRLHEDILDIEPFGPTTEPYDLQNQIRVHLKSGERMAEKNFQRHFYSNSSCGVCGKASIQALEMLHKPDIPPLGFCIHDEILRQLPTRLNDSQLDFERTGGIHGVSLIDDTGKILLTKEDVGRHNAMDKLLGDLVIAAEMDMHNRMVLVSGRASFELVQKSLVADIPFFAALGAPSSAAVDLANTFGTTLIGFLKNTGYNIYHGAHRISA